MSPQYPVLQTHIVVLMSDHQQLSDTQQHGETCKEGHLQCQMGSDSNARGCYSEKEVYVGVMLGCMGFVESTLHAYMYCRLDHMLCIIKFISRGSVLPYCNFY